MFNPSHPERLSQWGGDPFQLADESAYQRWRETKLDSYPTDAADLMVEVADALALTLAERAKILAHCSKSNMVLFHDQKKSLRNRKNFRSFATEFGLTNLSAHMLADQDGIATITPTPQRQIRGEYIPYTTRPLNWHTDGYYGDRPIKGFALYCLQAASEGGVSNMIDPEIVYIRLRDQSPDHIAAFSRPDAMTIPANVRDGVELRGENRGPVFSTDPETRQLNMRYTARTVSINWPDDAEMTAARQALDDILTSTNVFEFSLRAGDGILCNNVLHKRSAFSDPDRRLYRGRFLDRITDEE